MLVLGSSYDTSSVGKLLRQAVLRREGDISLPLHSDRITLLIAIAGSTPLWGTCHLEGYRHTQDSRRASCLGFAQEDQRPRHPITFLQRQGGSIFVGILRVTFVATAIVSVFEVEAQGFTALIDIASHLGRQLGLKGKDHLTQRLFQRRIFCLRLRPMMV